MAARKIRLIGDIGGTNARFAIAVGGAYQRETTYPTDRFTGLDAVITVFLKTVPPDLRPSEAAIAVAAPIQGDVIRMTNNGWQFSRAALERQFGFSRLLLLNDFAPVALALTDLDASEIEPVGGGTPVAGAPRGVLGPGTGLGVAGLVRGADGRWVAVTGEGGHATMPATDATEAAILAEIARRVGHVSAERVLSGGGLVNLFEALCALEGRPAPKRSPAEISDAASDDPLCHAAIRYFCAMLGTVAGNLALTLGAEGGIYIAGGIVPKLGPRFARSDFRLRFEAKGRLQPYLAAIPVYVIRHPDPALFGLARLPDA
jgi:glucokinase